MQLILQLFGKYERPCTSNQRLEFDIDPLYGRYLCSGTQEGQIKLWDLLNPVDLQTGYVQPLSVNTGKV